MPTARKRSKESHRDQRTRQTDRADPDKGSETEKRYQMLNNFRPDLSKLIDYTIGIGAGLMTAVIITVAMVMVLLKFS